MIILNEEQQNLEELNLNRLYSKYEASEVLTLCTQDVKSLGYTLPNIVLEYNNSTALAGGHTQASETTDTIYVSNHFLKDTNLKALKTLFYHELAHSVVQLLELQAGIRYWDKGVLYEYQVPELEDYTDHGKVWKEVISEFNTAFDVKITRTTDSASMLKARRYKIECDNCAFTYYLDEKTSFVLNPNELLPSGVYRYRCPNCGKRGLWRSMDARTGRVLVEPDVWGLGHNALSSEVLK